MKTSKTGLKKKHSLFELFPGQIKIIILFLAVTAISAALTHFIIRREFIFVDDVKLSPETKYFLVFLLCFCLVIACCCICVLLFHLFMYCKLLLRLRYLPVNQEEIKALGILNLNAYLKFIDDFLYLEYGVFAATVGIPSKLKKEIVETCLKYFDTVHCDYMPLLKTVKSFDIEAIVFELKNYEAEEF